MKFRLFLTLFCVFVLLTLSSQTFRFTGKIIDSISGDAIAFALIHDSIGNYTETDQYGNFKLTLKRGIYHFTISNVGYNTKQINVVLDNDFNKVIELNNITLQEVVILGGQSIKMENGSIDITPEKLRSIPTLFGEKDVLKALSVLPGVSQGNEGTNQLSVRGGSFDQNLILLDGSVLYNTSHFFGFLSAIDPFAIKSLRFYKDGFPAEYGGRTSSVIDIQLKEGNINKKEKYINVGLFTSSFGINGPIKKQKSSYLFSSRLAYPGILTLPFKSIYEASKINSFVSYFMYDLVGKYQYKFNDKHIFFVSGTKGKDFLLTGNRENNFITNWKVDWGNTTFAIRYSGNLSKQMDIKVSSNYNNYVYKSFLEGIETSSNYSTKIINQSKIFDYRVNTNINWNINSKIGLNSGIGLVISRIVPSISLSNSTNDTISGLESYLSKDYTLFQSIKFKPITNGLIQLGYRYNIYQYEDYEKKFFQPRIMFSVQWPSQKMDFYYSYSKMYQPAHLLLNSSNGYINEVWLAANKFLPPQQMIENSFGLHFQYFADLRIVLFKRFYKNLIDLKNNVGLQKLLANDWNQLFETKGEGFSKGVETSIMKNFQEINFVCSYTFNRGKNRFSGINEGNYFVSPVNRPHVLSINTDYLKNDRNSFTIGITYFSGLPYTLPDYYTGNNQSSRPYTYTTRYNTRLPAYKRIDFGFKRSVKNKRGLPKEWSFSIYNLLFNKNVTQILPATYGISKPDDPSINIGERPYFIGRSFFAFIPGINFYYKFK